MFVVNAAGLPRSGLAVADSAPGADPRPRGLKLPARLRATIAETVAGLNTWLDSARQPGGYAGPVAHWWSDCLTYTGPGLDWRYEGIVIGYIHLWAATGEPRWLAKAQRAGDDLVAGQYPSGNYRNSCFELNPNTGGTPHEAACDLALLRLATLLRARTDPNWGGYYQTAKRNLSEIVGRLWDAQARSFRDDPQIPSFVPNKAATLTEALFCLSELSGEEQWAERYALPTLQAILQHQIQGGELDGAIYQNSFGKHTVEKFFPYYIARCIPGLLAGWQWSGDPRLAEAAGRAARFILRWRYPDGSFPQVVYPHGRVNRYPQWVAATGDMLRALTRAREVGLDFDEQPTLDWLLAGRRPDGAIWTAHGFAKAGFGRSVADPRDELPVCGWIDKAFRYLTWVLDMSEE